MNRALAVSPPSLSSHRARTREVQARLAEKARSLGSGVRLPTASQLCAEFGTSARTLSDALAELEREGAVERVRGVGLFSRLPARKEGYVALVCDPNWFRGAAHSPFWDLLMEQFSARAQVEHESIETHFLQSHQERGFQLSASLRREVLAGRVRGVLNVGVPFSVSQWFEEHGVPVVAYAGAARYLVIQDHHALVRMGVQQLAAQGCRRIALWSWDDGPKAVFQEELAACGLPVEELLLRCGAGASNPQSASERGADAALDVFGSSSNPHEWPDGIVISDDNITEGALSVLRGLGVQVGCGSAALRIATHANRGSSVLAQSRALLTLLEMDVEELVVAMFDTLEKRMDGLVPEQEVLFLFPHLILPACPEENP